MIPFDPGSVNTAQANKSQTTVQPNIIIILFEFIEKSQKKIIHKILFYIWERPTL